MAAEETSLTAVARNPEERAATTAEAAEAGRTEVATVAAGCRGRARTQLGRCMRQSGLKRAASRGWQRPDVGVAEDGAPCERWRMEYSVPTGFEAPGLIHQLQREHNTKNVTHGRHRFNER